MKSLLIILAATALLTAGAGLAGQDDERLTITMTRHQLDPGRGENWQSGPLTLLGAWRLTANDPRFGGFSGLTISADGHRLLAVSDHGQWLRAGLTHRADGLLTSIEEAAMGPLLGEAGRSLAERGKAWRDAESLTGLLDGGLIVGFERQHRLLRYDSLEGRAAPFDTPTGQPKGSNEGLEALEELPDGRLVAFSEGLRAPDGNWRAWVHQQGAWRAFRYERRQSLAPVGAAVLPDGDLLMLERHFSVVGGLTVRLLRVAAEEIRPGALVGGALLAEWREPPLDIDNFEALAARPGPAGRTLIYLLADDNFNAPLQETLLLQLALR